jgi:phage shock protein PspC (stress-responsive transcriptional regulator)
MTTTPTPTPVPALDRLFNTLRRSPVTRSSDRMIAGVSAGIANRLGVSTAIVRVATVALAIMGPAIVLYLAAWLLLPDANGRIRLERAVRDGDVPSILLLVLTVLAVPPDAGFHGHVGWFPLVAIGAIAVVGHRAGWWKSVSARHCQPVAGNGTTQAPDSGPQDAPRA